MEDVSKWRVLKDKGSRFRYYFTFDVKKTKSKENFIFLKAYIFQRIYLKTK